MHVIFDPDHLIFSTYYQTGAGGTSYFTGLEPYQRGYGLVHRNQRGGGVGSVFKNIWRYLLPLVKASGAAVGKEGVATAARILGNLTHGTNLKDAIITESAEGVKNLADRARDRGVQKTKEMVDRAKEEMMQQGSGRGRKRNPRKSGFIINNLIGKSIPNKTIKRIRQDSLGFY